MDGSKKGLTRTNSSLLRSSPTIRSSIHSLSSVEEIVTSSDEEEKKNRKIRNRFKKPGSTGPVFLTVIFFIGFLYYLTRQEKPTSENLLLGLIFIAITLFLVNKNKSLIANFKTFVDESVKKINFGGRSKTHTNGKQKQVVQWYIGEDEKDKGLKSHQREVREGVEFYTNGDYYEGEFFKGKCNGSGVYNYNVNGRYEGEWIDGKYDGYGIESWARGSKYRGQYKSGMRDGFGVYKFFTGDCYAGEWCNGQSHGIGMQSCSDGSCYVGMFKCGAKHGLGCYHFRNGDRYAGEYFGDKIHGFGVYHFANGHCYEGSWHEGRKQGYGMYTFRNGESRCGEWDCGSLKTSLPPLTDAVLRAVQAARKTAENAIHLRRVDEQVNKAVMAANRAATSARVAAVKAVQNQMDGKFCDIENA